MSNQQRRADLPRHRNALADFQGAGYSALKPLADDIDAGLRKFLGPEGYAAFRRATGVADIVSPGADFRDAVQSSGEMVRNAISGNALGAVGSGAGMAAALGSVMIPGNTNALAKMADDAPAVGKKGIRAFHGSPHDFDKFSLDKIGTGEGAQAYGHGLYFAEAEDVARGYKQAGPEWSRQVGEINDELSRLARVMAADSSGYRNFRSNAGRDAAKKYDELMDARTKLGRMYEVNINADPDDFLDWDMPLSEQPKMFAKLKETGVIDEKAPPYQKTGQAPGRAVVQTTRSDRRAEEYLREAGIHGVKYLDAGSRGAGGGSRNYVVFDDSLVEILRKYGIGALVAGGAYALTDAEYAQAQEIIGDDNADDR